MVRAEPPMLPAMGRRFAITVRCSQTCMQASQPSITALSHFPSFAGYLFRCAVHTSTSRKRAIMEGF